SSGDYDYGLFAYSSMGVLDTGFGMSGVTTYNPGAGYGELHTMQVAGDGSLLVAGTLFTSAGGATSNALRYSSAGVRDMSYLITESNVYVEASALQADGKLVLSGADAQGNMWLARYDNGTRDVGFGTAGVVTTNFGPSANAYGLALLPAGK